MEFHISPKAFAHSRAQWRCGVTITVHKTESALEKLHYCIIRFTVRLYLEGSSMHMLTHTHTHTRSSLFRGKTVDQKTYTYYKTNHKTKTSKESGIMAALRAPYRETDRQVGRQQCSDTFICKDFTWKREILFFRSVRRRKFRPRRGDDKT